MGEAPPAPCARWQWTTFPREVKPSNPTTAQSSNGAGVARKTSIPSEQIERLKDLYNRQRETLVALAAAHDAVSAAEATLAAAQQGLRDAQSDAERAYQALVDLMGADAAAKLTGRRSNGKRASSTRAAQDNGQHPEPALNGPADGPSYS